VARIIVIGAGVAGLAAAARMASGVNEVTLVERNASPGGGAATWAGPHTLTLPAVLRDLFIKTGGRKGGSSGAHGSSGALEDVVDLRPVDPVRRFVFPDGTRLDLPNTARGATKEAFDGAFGPGSGEAWLRVLDHGNRAWSAVRPTLVEVPDAGRAELWRLLRSAAARRALAPRRTLRQIGAEAGIRDPRMLRVLDEYALGAGADPADAPAVLTIRPYIEHAFGTWRVVGGTAELVTAMYERCVARGVTFRFGTAANAVAAGSVTLADGERLDADVIVAAVDAHVLAGLTGSKRRGVAAYSPSAYCVRLTLDEATAAAVELPHETVLFGAQGAPGAPGGRGGQGGQNERTIRVHAAPEKPREWIVTVTDPETVTPTRDDAETVTPTRDDAETVPPTRELAAALAKELAGRLGVVGDGLTVADVITPADFERLTGTPGGSLHGPVADSLSSAILRSPTVQPIRGLLHIGGSARPGPGLAFAALGAWNAAEVVKPTRT
jgi:phytoene dehydrogenase-like protein